MHAVKKIQRIATPIMALALLLGLPGGQAFSTSIADDAAAAETRADSADIIAYRAIVAGIETESKRVSSRNRTTASADSVSRA